MAKVKSQKGDLNLMPAYQLDNTKFLSEAEQTELLRILKRYQETNFRDTLLIELSLRSGGRESEILNLTTKSLIGEHRSILIKGLKGSSDREIPLPFDLYARLLSLHTQPGQRLFDISARRYRQIWSNYRPCPKSLHSLRHTFAINLYKKHRDLRLVQVALGHKNIQNTMVYAAYVYQTEELRRLLC